MEVGQEPARGRITLPPTIFRSRQGACGMETSSHLALLSRGPEGWGKGSQVLRTLPGGAVGMGSRAHPCKL